MSVATDAAFMTTLTTMMLLNRPKPYTAPVRATKLFTNNPIETVNSREFDMKTFHEGLRHADYVVGHYGKNGGLIKSGGISGESEALQEHRQAFYSNASLVKGAEVVRKKTKKPKGRKPTRRTAPETYDEEFIPLAQLSYNELDDANALTGKPSGYSYDDSNTGEVSEKPLKEVELHNEFGRIKMFVEDYIEIDIAIMLIFREQKDVIFIPKTGQLLNMSIANRIFEVYYPDTLFPWPDNKRKVMVLIKKENQDE